MTFPNGVYFGMEFEAYDAIERLSKTRLKQIMVSPADFWAASWLNPTPLKLTPEQERRKKIALLLGKAYHCARLEPDEFHQRFARELSPADFAHLPDFLATGSAIEAELARRDQPKKFKDDDGVLGQARRLQALGYEGTIWHIEEAAWREQLGDRLTVPAEAFDQIEIDMLRLASVPDVHSALSNGAPEVVILYDCPDTGLPMKARLDWLRGDGWAEFKSFANPNGKNLAQCLLDAIKYNRYYIDVAAYHEAVEAIRNGHVHVQGEHEPWQAEMIELIQLAEKPLPHKIIFQQKGGIPNVLSRDLRLYDVPLSHALHKPGAPVDKVAEAAEMLSRPTMLYGKARAEIRRAKKTFLGYSEIYPRGEPWLPFEPHAEISDLDFHQSWLETA